MIRELYSWVHKQRVEKQSGERKLAAPFLDSFFVIHTVVFPQLSPPFHFLALLFFAFHRKNNPMFYYEALEVYKKAFQVNQHIHRLRKQKSTIASYAKNQWGRASLGIMLNIAEGCAKFTNRDRRNFYVMARGSIFECSSLVSFLCTEQEIDIEMKEILYSLFEEISRMLFTMINNLLTNQFHFPTSHACSFTQPTQ